MIRAYGMKRLKEMQEKQKQQQQQSEPKQEGGGQNPPSSDKEKKPEGDVQANVTKPPNNEPNKQPAREQAQEPNKTTDPNVQKVGNDITIIKNNAKSQETQAEINMKTLPKKNQANSQTAAENAKIPSSFSCQSGFSTQTAITIVEENKVPSTILQEQKDFTIDESKVNF